MASYDVFLRTSKRKRERAGFEVKGTFEEARRMAAHILDVDEDLIILQEA